MMNKSILQKLLGFVLVLSFSAQILVEAAVAQEAEPSFDTYPKGSSTTFTFIDGRDLVPMDLTVCTLSIAGVETPCIPDDVEAGLDLTPTILADPVIPSAGNMLSVAWSEEYGPLSLPAGLELTNIRIEDGLFLATIGPTASLPSAFIVKSERNEDCWSTIDLTRGGDSLRVIDLGCRMRELIVPQGMDFAALGCFRGFTGQALCLLPEMQATLDISIPGWKPALVDLPQGRGPVIIDFNTFTMNFVPEMVQESLVSTNLGYCRERDLRVELSDFCQNQEVCFNQGSGFDLGASAEMPSMSAFLWQQGGLPTSVAFRMVERLAGVDTILSEKHFLVGESSQSEILKWVADVGGTATLLPLEIAVKSGDYKFGRLLQTFSDSTCQSPIEGQSVDLSNPGNRLPMVQECGFFSVFDAGKRRSLCAPLVIDTERLVAMAEVEVDACEGKRLVILVSENGSMNGSVGKIIGDSIGALVEEMRSKPVCVGVDIVHTIDADRALLLSAEDIFFSEPDEDLQRPLLMGFVNRNSEVLRDLEWAYREWRDRIGAIIVLADASQIRINDIIDSPALLAWGVKGVDTTLLNTGERQVCATFEDVFLVNNCLDASAESLQGALFESINAGLRSIGASGD